MYIDKQGLFLNPNFKDFSYKELKDYIRTHIEKEFREQLITDVSRAVRWYEHLYSNGTMMEDEKELHINISRDYFNGKFN